MQLTDLLEPPHPGEKPRYIVETADDPTDEDYTISWRFHDKAKAEACAKELAEKFRCVWLSEWGSWLDRRGNKKEGWFNFWWTDLCGFQASPASSGRGIREGDPQKKLRDYLPSPR